jgi:hypothetical protein
MPYGNTVLTLITTPKVTHQEYLAHMPLKELYQDINIIDGIIGDPLLQVLFLLSMITLKH